MEFKTAERRAIPVCLALMGKSGSGKTYSALLLAKGILGTMDDVFVIDTERGRAELYADDPRIKGYRVGQLSPPFTAQSFVDSIDFAVQQGAKCIIIDSASHEWSGIGGCLEQVDDIIAKSGERARMIAWARVKSAHRRFVNTVAAPPVHLILCLRAKDKMDEVVQNGKKVWVKRDDPVAEQQADFIFEMTAAAIIDGDHQARWTKVPQPLLSVLHPGVIGEEQGEGIGNWVAGGTVYNEEAARHLSALREASYEGGTAAMSAYWGTKIKGQVTPAALSELTTHLDELRRLAEEQDALIARQNDAVATAGEEKPERPTPIANGRNPFADPPARTQ